MKNHIIYLNERGHMHIVSRGATTGLNFAPGECDELIATLQRLQRVVASRVEMLPTYERGYGNVSASSDEVETK